MLETIGLDPLHERVYLAVLAAGLGDRAAVAGAAGLEPAALDEVLAALAAAGLLHDDAGRMRVVPPDVALGRAVVDRIEELRRVQLAIAKLVHDLPDPELGALAPGAVETLHGRTAIAARYAQLQHSARSEIRSLSGGPAIAVEAGANTGQQEALAAGIRYRVVYERAMLDPADAESPLLLEHWAELGEEMRVAETVPCKLVLVDRRAALVVPRTQGAGDPVAMVVRSGALLDLFDWVFDRVWDSSLPVPAAILAGPGGPLTAEARMLLSLLLAGYTDGAIAERLGISLRTVQRRIGQLIALAGVQTRLQLGWQAARLGWL